MNLGVVVAVDKQGFGIGLGGHMPWPALSQDLRFFRKVTTATSLPHSWNAVIMGRVTWESLSRTPLPDRLNIVLQSACAPRGSDLSHDNVRVASSLDEALAIAEAVSTDARPVETCFVIGGRRPILDALRHPALSHVFVTTVEAGTRTAIPCDVWLPELETEVLANPTRFRRISSLPVVENGYELIFNRCSVMAVGAGAAVRAPTDESQYLTLIRDVLQGGVVRGDRTGVGTLSTFGAVLRFSLAGNVLPLFTTKTVFWRGVVEELLWFVSGCTDAKVLAAKGVRIWDGNGSREFLDSRGLTDRAVGDLGPVYGFQWRHFGAAYGTSADDYTGAGIDQLQAVIDAIKTDPTSRRIVMTAWNPADLSKMALPPCHMFCQFYVDGDQLDCQMYQRSADLGLGVPFNVASYALLTHMVAFVCGLHARNFIHVIGDAHVYSTHVDALKEQLTRTPRPFPKLFIVGNEARDINAFTAANFVVKNYTPHPPIKMPMAV